MVLRFTSLVRDSDSFNSFIRILEDMEKGSGGVVLPDMEVINAGCYVCECYDHFKALWAVIVRLEMKPNMRFFNNWLNACYRSAAEVEWVCDRAKDAGCPDLNHKSRGVFWGLCRGSRKREACKKLPLRETISLRDWILRNRRGDLWTYVVEKAINPIAGGGDDHVRGIGPPTFMSKGSPPEPPCFGVLPSTRRGRVRTGSGSLPEVAIRGKGIVSGSDRD